ncbi:flagellar hook-basal body protein [Paenibacillus sp. GCM10012307]|uniref:Flagellar hook-basal body protein n=1 Tax=Paenibacillus roseus TaxID=2798579 RepID=A0A934MVA4_9BACL|nr:flagellar hook-basal body protein [Paenibacillus roseus]MBJ6361902.1 flagellar hook-basal body protein [Paenibacillus roseus]
MNSSMINAMVSMNGMQQKLDLLADNIANVNTVGYKRKEASFEDLLTNMKQQGDAFRQPVRLTPLGFNQGWGSRLTMVQPDMAQGPIQPSDNPYDIAIQGDALFEVQTSPDGNRAYTRSGSFQMTLDANGIAQLTTPDGYPVIAQLPDGQEGPIRLPDGYTLRVQNNGELEGVSRDGFTTVQLGRMKLVQAMKPGVLTPVADNLFVVAEGLDREAVVRTVVPGENQEINLMQGYLEQSNVNLTNEMTELMIVQRAYQMSARALTSSDTMMGLANSLRG